MTAARPLCAVCFSQPREPGTARCADCGPGRIRPATPARPMSPLALAAERRAAEDITYPEDDHR